MTDSQALTDRVALAILRRVDSYLWWGSLLLAIGMSCIAAVVYMDAHRPTMTEYASGLTPVTGELLSKEIKMIPYRDGNRRVLTLLGWQKFEGYWCAIGTFALIDGDLSLEPPRQVTGVLSVFKSSRVKGTSPSEPWHFKSDAEADLERYRVGHSYHGWLHRGDPTQLVLHHPMQSAVRHLRLYLFFAAFAMGYFALRTSLGIVVLRRYRAGTRDAQLATKTNERNTNAVRTRKRRR